MSTATEHGDIAGRSLAALLWTYLGGLGRSLAQLVIQLLLARHLGPQAFGEATVAFFVLGIGWLMAEGGFGAALVQKATLSDDDIAYALGWVLCLSCGTGALVALLAGPIAGLLGAPGLTRLVQFAGLLIPLQAVSNVPASLMRRNLDMKRQQLIQVGAYVFSYGVVGLLLAWWGAGAWSLMWAFAVQSIVLLVLCYAAVRHPLRISLKGDAAMRRFGLSVMGTNLANWAIENVDRFVISRQWGTAPLGEYAAASNLSRAPAGLLVNSMQNVALAAASRVQDEPERLVRGYLGVLALTALLVAPAFAFLAMHAQMVIHVLYGESWAGVTPLFAAFCVGLPFYAMLAVTGPTLWAVGAVSSEMKAQAVCAILLLLGFVLLSGTTLALAVWLIPALYLLRFILVFAPLARRLQIPLTSLLRALRGSSIFVLISVIVSLVGMRLVGDGLWLAVLMAVATVLLCLVVLRLVPQIVVGDELRGLLLARARQMPLLEKCCGVLGIQGAGT